MRLIRGLHNLRPDHHGSAVTIGNFDGLHQGHQAVLQQLHERAARQGLMTTVMTFEPTPQEYFASQSAPARLQRLRDKLALLRTLSVDQVLCVRFNRKLAELSAAEFVDRIMLEGLNVRFLVVGDDFRFGKGREGDFAFLRNAGRRAGFEVVSTRPLPWRRSCQQYPHPQTLERGDLRTGMYAGTRLSHLRAGGPGHQLGRTIGFHTANVRLHRLVSPVRGVFAVKVFGLGNNAVEGVANIGTRPTVDGSTFVLEVHLFDFDQDIYGRYLDVESARDCAMKRSLNRSICCNNRLPWTPGRRASLSVNE